MSKATGGPERTVNGLLSVARLLEEPRLARLYTFVLRNEEVTIDDIADELDMPRTTAYSDTGTLVDLGALTRDDDQKTHTYGAIPITLTATLDGDEYTVTPTLIAAFGRSPTIRISICSLSDTTSGTGCRAHLCGSVRGWRDVRASCGP